jgi:inositol-1,3,4-trisphosphate 5/6-kinase/inositol-tetrakisphosphate 1-kinase
VIHDWSGGGLADILDSSNITCPDSNVPMVQFVQLDHDVPISKQPHCAVVIHKLTEDIDNESKEARSKLQALEKYLLAHPSTVIVDPIECVRKVVSRARTCRHLTAIQDRLRDRCPFTQPSYVVIEEKLGDEGVLAMLAQQQLHFPVICKPVQACGTAKSHSMVSSERFFCMETSCSRRLSHPGDPDE